MKGKVFHDEIKTLFKDQTRVESSIDFDKVLATAGGKEELKLSHDVHDISEFFMDPTLFSLLREYNDGPTLEEVSTQSSNSNSSNGGDPKPSASRTRTNGNNNDHSKIRTPQAKDVLPNRILEENNSIDDTTGKESNGIPGNDNTPVLNQEQQQRQLESSTHSQLRNLLPNIPNENDDDDNYDALNGKPHPDIPKTRLSKKFLAMATELERSCLRTIKKEFLMDIPPRLRQPNNYAIHRQNNTTTTETTKGKKKVTTKRGATLDSQASMKRSRQRSDPLIFSFSIYQAHKPSKKLQEFSLLGNHTLTDVRDAIYCRMDFSAHGDRVDRDPDGSIINTLRQKLSPSFFYINNTFYIDRRRPSVDTVSVVREWLTRQQQQRQQDKETPALEDMDSIGLQDLVLELNKPYLFDHQDHCQHVVLVRDIRMMEPKDEKDPDKYPLVTYSWRYTRYKCTMCMIYPAVYVTTNDYLSGFSPCYFCERCHGPFHYDENGDTVTTFNNYTYHGT